FLPTLRSLPRAVNSYERLLNPDFRGQSLGNRTAFSNRKQPFALSFGEISDQLDANVEAVDVAGAAGAVGAVFGVHPIVGDGDLGAFERNVFALGDHAHGHRGAATETCGEEIVGSGTFIGSAGRGRFIRDQAMLARFDFVAKGGTCLDDHGT